MPGRSASTWSLGVLIALAVPASAFAGGQSGCVSNNSCSAPAPSCSRQTTSGVDNCGTTCYRYFNNQCNAQEPSCARRTTTGRWTCGGSCTKTFNNYCTASDPSCGQTTRGRYVCGGTCARTGGACYSNPWQPYGYAIPGDPKYGFGLPDNKTKTLLAIAAKGNVILGDYTTNDFNNKVRPKIGRSAGSITQPYAIDESDAALGYHDRGFTSDGAPRFSGNYDQWDQGYKLDASGNPTNQKRKFYESSLADAQFKALVEPNWNPSTGADYGEVDAVMFTNHLMAGWAPHDYELYNFGSMVARDDAFMFEWGFRSDHDARLVGVGGGIAAELLNETGLPLSVGRPTLQRWQECSPDPNAVCSP